VSRPRRRHQTMITTVKGSPLAAFLVALAVTGFLTPWVRRLAVKNQAVAKPDARRLHPEPIAQWGGLAVYLGVAIAALLWRQPTLKDLRQLSPSSNQAVIAATAQSLHLSATFLGCGLLMMLLGMVDDRFELNPLLKFSGQALVTALLWHGGVRITTLPFTSGLHSLSPGLSLFFTELWVLGLTNGINFIDGVDGLASGVCAIAAGSLCLMQVGRAPWAAAAAAALCGACIGFLRYNFHPAKIFLGDTGSLLLGFWLASIALAAAAKTAAATTLALPLLVLGIPVADIAWAFIRRSLAGQPVWRADRGHLHHRLLERGLSPVKTVLVLYSVGFVLGAVAIVWARH